MITRRAVIASGLALPMLVGLPTPAHAAPGRPDIRPRAAWATGHPVRGRLVPEGDVRFLLVHHTLTPNGDRPEEIPDRIRSVYAYHTRTKGWPDVAYNFFVDPAGGIWEGRQGSIDTPVRGDATGGSQGFAELACFVGDFTSVVPTAAAMDAMVGLLAWLAARSSLSLDDTATFTSRGSNRWPKGVTVTTPRIAGHRDMSRTECPGDALYPLVASELLPRAAAALVPSAATPPPSPSPGSTASPEPTAAPEPTASPEPAAPAGAANQVPYAAIAGGAAAGVGALGATAAWVVRRRRASAQDEHRGHGDPPEGQGGQQGDHETDRGH